MWMVLGVFVGVMVTVYGLYWLLVVRDEEAFLKRLRPTDGSGETRRMRGFLEPEERLSSVAPLHAALEKSKLVGPLKLMLEQSAVKLNLGSFLILSACMGAAGYLLGFFLVRMMFVGLLFGGVLATLPYLYVKRARNKRTYKFE